MKVTAVFDLHRFMPGSHGISDPPETNCYSSTKLIKVIKEIYHIVRQKED
jgi:hypothetical protein